LLNAYRAGARLAQAVPASVAEFAGGLLGLAMAAADADRRRVVGRNLQRVHGRRLNPAELRREVRRAFASYARYWVEVLRLPAYSPDDLDAAMTAKGLEHLDAALAEGKGAVVALPHLGGWDFGGAWLATRGYRMTVVVEALDPPEAFEWFVSFRRSLGLDVIPLGPAAGKAVLRALRDNRVVALLSDRDIAGGGVEVDFFGERTTLPAGPITLALRAGAPVLPTTIYTRGRMHHGVVCPPLDLTRQGSLRDDVARLTQDLAHELERLIAAAPEQWHVFQPNWPSDKKTPD
jgi:lauroyl/myristoyl acyltransferase